MRRVLTPKWWLAHLVVLVAVLVMLRLGLWQWHRAESPSGGLQNYAYAAQWPLFAVFAVVVWVKTLIEEVRRDGSRSSDGRQQALPPEGAGVLRQPGLRVGVATPVVEAGDDEELQEWNARFAALRAADAATHSRRAAR